MSLKKSKGNMYDWVTHMHSHLGGECSHKCSYCYVQKNRFGVSLRYHGDARLLKDELKINYGVNKTIFIEHMNDMFAKNIHVQWIKDIIMHCNKYPKNQYIIQTKNPQRAFGFLDSFTNAFMIGTTIETNRNIKSISTAPSTIKRYDGIKRFKQAGIKTFITIEPILDFDVDILASWIIDANPDFINIGADSKYNKLPEPSSEKILKLVDELNKNKIHIRKKINLERLLKK